MCWKKKVLIILIAFSIIGTQADGEFSVIYTSESVTFTGHSMIHENLLKELLSIALGMAVKPIQWSGIYINNPFDMPEAVAHIQVQGVTDLGSTDAWVKTYPMETDDFEPNTFDHVKSRLELRTLDPGNKYLNIRMANYKMVTENFPDLDTPEIPLESLNHLETYISEDITFLRELANLNAVIDWINKGYMFRDNMPDFYFFRVSSIQHLSDYHGPTSRATVEAKTLLREAVLRLSDAIVRAYDGSAVVTLACVSDTPLRIARRVQVARDVKITDFVILVEYFIIFLRKQVYSNPVFTLRQGEEECNAEAATNKAIQAVIMQIFLWLSIVTSLSLIGAVHKILSMDPGKNSINYRLTMTSTKKTD